MAKNVGAALLSGVTGLSGLPGLAKLKGVQEENKWHNIREGLKLRSVIN